MRGVQDGRERIRLGTDDDIAHMLLQLASIVRGEYDMAHITHPVAVSQHAMFETAPCPWCRLGLLQTGCRVDGVGAICHPLHVRYIAGHGVLIQPVLVQTSSHRCVLNTSRSWCADTAGVGADVIAPLCVDTAGIGVLIQPVMVQRYWLDVLIQPVLAC